MNSDFLFALYVFCMNYHSGQWSRGYRILSRLTRRHVRISDRGIECIQGNRHTREDLITHGYGDYWDEWEQSRVYYRELKRKYAGKV